MNNISAGDYVRVVEGLDMGDDQNMIYMTDIQAVHRVVTVDDTIAVIETLRGTYAMMTFQVYLVDTSALHAEMEEMLTEDVWQAAWDKYEAEPTRDNAVAFIIANLRVTVNEAEAEIDMAKSLHESMVKTYEARLADYARECAALQAHVALLTERLTPFAKAALDEDVHPLPDTDALEVLDASGNPTRILCGDGMLEVHHLREALEVLPDVAGSANAADESQ